MSFSESNGVGSQPTRSTRRTCPPSDATSRKTLAGSRSCASISGIPSGVVRIGGSQRLDHINSPRFFSARHGIDENRHVAPVEKRVGQIDPTNAEIDHAHALGPGSPVARALRYLDAEGVVAEEDIADAGDEDAGRGLWESSLGTPIS